MKATRRYITIIFSALRAFVAATSSFAFLFAGSQTQAAPPPTTRQSAQPVLSQPSYASISKLAADIKEASAGSVTPTNIHVAIAEAVASNPGVHLDMLAGAINRLNLANEALSVAIQASMEFLGRDTPSILAALIADAHLTSGKEAAQTLTTRLRFIAGDDAVEIASRLLPVSSFETIEALRDIQPASGLYDG